MRLIEPMMHIWRYRRVAVRSSNDGNRYEMWGRTHCEDIRWIGEGLLSNDDDDTQ